MNTTLPRVRVSDLDTFGFWRRGEEPIEALCRDLLERPEPTDAMRAGSALDAFLDAAQTRPDIDRELFAAPNGITLDFRPAAGAALYIPRVREVPMERRIEALGVVVSGRADGIDERGLHEYKLTSRPDPQLWEAKQQWRWYLYLSGEDRITYHLLHRGRERMEDDGRLIVEVRGVDEYLLRRYPTLLDDCHAGLEEFVATLKRAGVWGRFVEARQLRLVDLAGKGES